MENSTALLTSGNINLGLSVVAAYSLALLYTHQLGFLNVVGFQFAAMTSPFDVLTSAGLVLAYAVPAFFVLIFLMMSIQGASQVGIDLARWIADRETAISVVTTVVLLVAVVARSLGRQQQTFVLIGILINLIGLVAILYATFLADHKIQVWSLLFAVTNPFWLSFGLGYQSAYYSRTIDTRRYDVWLEREQLSNVRLIRFSSSGIFYVEDKRDFIGFVSMSKVVKVVQTLP